MSETTTTQRVPQHQPETVTRWQDDLPRWLQTGAVAVEPAQVRDLEAAADTLTRAALWTVVHLTYARRVHIDGAPLAA
ncbi:MAG: hypothetical protein ACOCZK_06970, partial [Planctomycetota bacterium]